MIDLSMSTEFQRTLESTAFCVYDTLAATSIHFLDINPQCDNETKSRKNRKSRKSRKSMVQIDGSMKTG